MTQRNDGGSAFPQNTKYVHAAGQEVHMGFMGGMTLRDYFAAKAMQGVIQFSATKGIVTPSDDELAKAAYGIADAMLEARK